MSSRRILIVSTAHLCRNPRVLKEATTLAQHGYQVTVLTLTWSDRFEAQDQSLLGGAAFRRVTLDFRPSRRRWPTFRARASTWVARQVLRRTRIELPAALGPAYALRNAARSIPADLTIAHNEIPLWSAGPLQADGRRVAVDFEDWYSEDLLENDRRARPLRLLQRAEQFALQHAAYATTTSAAMAEGLVKSYAGRKPAVIRNVFPLQKDPFSGRNRNQPPALVWFSQTIGPGRGLEEFVSAWGRTRNRSQISLIGDVAPAFQRRLLDAVPAERRSDLQWIPFVPPEALPGKLADFDIGLALEPRIPRNKDLTISNKIFQYLNAGLGIIATNTAGQREVMDRAAGAGLLVSPDPAAVTAQLEALISDPSRLHDCQRAARAAAEREFCWEKESGRLLSLVSQSFSS